MSKYEMLSFFDGVKRERTTNEFQLKGRHKIGLEFAKLNAPDKCYITIELVKYVRRNVFGKKRVCRILSRKFVIGAFKSRSPMMNKPDMWVAHGVKK